MNKISILLLASAILCVATLASAQTGGEFELTWSTIDAGGGTSSGGEFVLDGTIGQPDAGELSGGEFALSGGFWNDVIADITPDTSSYIRLY
jgi:hypothetical protein